jgi:hypothetical protein
MRDAQHCRWEDMTPIPEEGVMPRIIVTTDPTDRREEDSPVLLDERVDSLHLCDDHAAEQLIERLAWAVSDAEDTQKRLLHA